MNYAAATKKLEPPVTAGRVPPNDPKAEAAVLSASLLKRGAFDEVAGILKPEDFYSEANETIFRALVDLATNGRPIDTVTVGAWLRDRELLARVGGPAYLAEIVDATPAVANVESHAEIVRMHRRQRALIAECQRVQAEGYGDVGDPEAWMIESEGAIGRAVAKGEQAEQAEQTAPIVARVFQKISEVAEGKEELGFGTGNSDLDRLLGGLRPGQITIVGARSHIGKSSLARQIGQHVAGINRPHADGAVLLWSGEQPREETVECMTFQTARVPMAKLKTKKLDQADWAALTATAQQFHNAPFYVDDVPAVTILSLLSAVRVWKRQCERKQRDSVAAAKADGRDPERARQKWEPVMVIVDYLQLMSAAGIVERNANREREVSAISKRLKQLAMKERVHIIVAAQLNKDGDKRKNSRPIPADLRESNSVEQDADKIILIHNEHAQERMHTFRDGNSYALPETEVCELIVAKARGGGTTGIVRAVFFPPCATFGQYDGRDG